MFTLRGKVDARLMDNRTPRHIIDKYVRGDKLSDHELHIINDGTKCHHVDNNTMMDRMLDRLAAVFAHSQGTSFYNSVSQQYDGDYYQQAISELVYWQRAWSLHPSINKRLNVVPELIGLGEDTTDPTPEDRGLITPMDYYRNTWNTREGGTSTATLDNNTIRCGAIWADNAGDTPPNTIKEIGLFVNWVYTGIYGWTGGGPWTFAPGGSNHWWEVLNLFEIADSSDVTFPYVLKTYRRDTGDINENTFDFDRLTEIVTYTGRVGAPEEPTVNNTVIMFYSPAT